MSILASNWVSEHVYAQTVHHKNIGSLFIIRRRVVTVKTLPRQQVWLEQGEHALALFLRPCEYT